MMFAHKAHHRASVPKATHRTTGPHAMSLVQSSQNRGRPALGGLHLAVVQAPLSHDHRSGRKLVTGRYGSPCFIERLTQFENGAQSPPHNDARAPPHQRNRLDARCPRIGATSTSVDTMPSNRRIHRSCQVQGSGPWASSLVSWLPRLHRPVPTRCLPPQAILMPSSCTTLRYARVGRQDCSPTGCLGTFATVG